MRFSARRHANAFPVQCEVRGCRSMPQEWFEFDHHSFDVCSAHGLQLRAGEAHSVQDDELLVGPEAASELLDLHISTTPTGTVLTLWLGHHGLVDQEVPLKVTPTLRASMRDMLRDEDDPEAGPA
ncbi:hypothetical protein [Brachybacterium sacelli]